MSRQALPFKTFSSGAEPDRPHELTLSALSKQGIDTQGLASKSLDDFADEHFDTVVVLCDKAQQAYRDWQGNSDEYLYWDIRDPRLIGGGCLRAGAGRAATIAVTSFWLETVLTATVALSLGRLAVGELAEVSLTIAPGETHCLSGPSGSGKSRLLRAVADLEPHDGKVWLGDIAQALLPAHAWRGRVMLVPADSHWWADTVDEHLPGARPADLEALGFTPEVLGWQVSRLSSGEKQRLALLRAISREPVALLLDEPTANLDDATTRRVEAWLMARIRERGWPVIWVAHDPGQIRRVADRHWRIEGSALVEVATWA